MARKRDRQVKIWASEDELQAIDHNVERANMSRNDYVISCATGKEIIVIPEFNEGFKLVSRELKRIGNNLNQLTKMAHTGRIPHSNELNEISEEVHHVWLLLNQLSLDNQSRH